MIPALMQLAMFAAMFGLIFAITGCNGRGGKARSFKEWLVNALKMLICIVLPACIIIWLIVKFVGPESF